MQAPNIPPGETERLTELRSYEVLDTESDATLDAITELAAQILDAPIALISLVDSDRQWFKSRYGLSATETAREIWMASSPSTTHWVTPPETRC